MLVPQAEGRFTVKLLDFGVARSLDDETQLTRTGLVVGTLEYMAPEQILGEPVDGRADLYAAGLILFELLTGQTPFKGTAAASMLYHQVNTTAPALSSLAPALPHIDGLERVVARCLAKRPDERFADAASLSAALAAAFADAPTSTHAALEAAEELPYLTCAVCGVDASRFATECAQCGTRLDTAAQRAFSARTIGERRTAAVTADARARTELASAQPVQLEAPAPVAVPSSGVERARRWLGELDGMVFVRTGTYALLAAAVFSFFGLISGGTARGLVALGVTAFVGLLVRRES
jgi:hypothetical protein